MKYIIEIDDNCPPIEPREFDNMPDACDYAVGYVADEYEENPEPGTMPNGRPFLKRDLYAAIGLLSSGFAQGGDFAVVFQGETIRVRVQYANLDEMLSVLRDAERFAIDQDPDAPGDEDELAEFVAEKRAALSNYGDPDQPWSMWVDTTQRDPEEVLHGPYNEKLRLHEQRGRVSWCDPMGVVTAWEVK